MDSGGGSGGRWAALGVWDSSQHGVAPSARIPGRRHGRSFWIQADSRPMLMLSGQDVLCTVVPAFLAGGAEP